MSLQNKATIIVRDLLPVEQYVFIEHMQHLFEGEKYTITQRENSVEVTLWKKKLKYSAVPPEAFEYKP